LSLLLLLTATSTDPTTAHYVVSFTGYIPSARYDQIPWTRVLVEEAPAKTGPWTSLVTGDLIPVDVDPRDPETRDITVRGATLAAGWYRLTFLDDIGNRQPTDPVYNGTGITPAAVDIARRMRTAVVDEGGRPVAFSDTTRPSLDDVEGFIRSGVRRVRMKVGSVSDDLSDYAKEVVELYAAAQAELARWPEQAGTVNSPYDALMAEFTTALADLVIADEQTPSGGDEVVQTFAPIGLWPGRGVTRPVRSWWP
jgi:hypothetical protein